jgi:2-dehydropantoate 2-reductase
MEASLKRIGIIGSGAVGCYFGAKMGMAGAEVRFLMRGDLDAVRGGGRS